MTNTVDNTNSAPMPAWLKAAYKEMGTKELPGPKSNPKVMQYYVEATGSGVNDDSTTPWCAAYVNAMLHRGNIKGNGKLAARSFESWGQPLKEPILGCVATKKRAGSSWQGHVGFVVAANKTTIWLIGGNQGDKVSIASFKRSEFTSFRWPANIAIPANLALPTTLAGAESNVSQA